MTVILTVACQTNPPPPEASPPAQLPVTVEAVVTPPLAEPEPEADLPPTPPAEPQPVFDASATGSTALLGLIGQPDTLNPHTDNQATLRELAPLLFETLLQPDPDTAELRPGLAEAWQFSADGRRVEFRLPPNLAWSNGTPLTAAAIADSLRATRHPALTAFSSITAPDETTLTLTASTVNCSAVTALAQLPLLSSAEFTATVPTGSGPFVVANWPENKRSLELVRNPHYHGTEPELAQIVVRFLGQDEIGVALSEGQFDLVGPLPSPLASERSPSTNLAIPARFTDLPYPAGQMIYLAVNYAPKNGEPLPPPARQALGLALDRDNLLAEVLHDEGQLLAGPLLPSHWAAAASLTPPVYDPAAARQLLSEAGLRDTDGDGWLEQNGERLELSIRLNGQNLTHQNLGWLISSYYRDLGLFARAEGAGFDSIVDDLFTHDFQLALFSWPIPVDPDQQLYWRSTENREGIGLNVTSYANPQLDRLLDQGNMVPGCDPETRRQTYVTLQEILSRERPVDFLIVPNYHLLLGERLRGVRPGPFAPLTWNVTEWNFQED